MAKPQDHLLKCYIESHLDRDFVGRAQNKAFFIIGLQGNVAYASKVTRELFGISENLLLSMNLADLFFSENLNAEQSFFKDKDPETLTTFDTLLKQGVKGKVTYFPIYFQGLHVGNFIGVKRI